jgi:hypothetical protein
MSELEQALASRSDPSAVGAGRERIAHDVWR